MYHHPDCLLNNNTDKFFKPHGSYSKKHNQYNCGASLYEKSKDFEVLENLIHTLHSAQLYAYSKSKIKHKIADIDYSKFNGRFYKYKDKPNPNDTKIPSIYILFHTKANSVPHLHMHTYIDSDGNNLDNLIQSHRIKNKEYFNYKNLIGGDIGEELFGSDDYIDFLHNNENTISEPNKKSEYVYLFGDQKANERILPTKMVKPTPWKDKYDIQSDYYNDTYKTLFAGSFEYLFKKIIGIEDDDEKMNHNYIFDDPYYEGHENLFDDQHKKYDQEIQQHTEKFLKDKYENTKKLYYGDNNIHYNEYIDKNDGITSEYNKNESNFSTIKTLYGNNNDEKHIMRQSTTENDSLMLLVLQIASIDNSNIGGYFGHIAPLFNKWNNITHSEICLFNSVDYPFKPIKNALFSTCNNEYSHFEIEQFILIGVQYYIRYRNESQIAKKILDTGNIQKIDLIKNFFDYTNIFDSNFDSTNLKGGKNIYNQNNIYLHRDIQNHNFKIDKTPENKPENKPENDQSLIKHKNTINELLEIHNKQYPNFKIDNTPKNKDFLLKLIACINFNIQPTPNQKINFLLK